MLNLPFIEGLILGLTLSVLLGPVFFALIQISIQKGFKQGIMLAIGISLSDLSLILVSYLGFSSLINTPRNNLLFGIIGGIILIIFGIVTFTKKLHQTEQKEKKEKIKTTGLLPYILKGYFLNIANPFLWIFWITVIASVSSTYNSNHNLFLFFLGAFITIFFTDLIKCFIANKIKTYLNINKLQLLNRIVGASLTIFGFVLIFRVFNEFYY